MHDSPDVLRVSLDAKPLSSSKQSGVLQSRLEMAHILFMDIAGYSKLTMKDQCDVQNILRQTVQDTHEYQAARAREEKNEDQLICRPSGDGMSLLFFGSPLEPVRCAIQITEALRSHSHFQLRMGIHTGLIQRVPDINGHADVAGAGIVAAQRVMDQGDAGHILISGDSKAAFENLEDFQYPMGHLFLSDLGNCVIKHGHSVRVFSLRDKHYGKPKFGNPIVPKKMRPSEPVIILSPPPPPRPALLVSIISSLKIAAGGILLIVLIRGICQMAVPDLYNKATNLGAVPAAAQAGNETPSVGSSQYGRQAGMPVSDQVPVPDVVGMEFGQAQTVAAQSRLALVAHDNSGSIAPLPTDMTYDHQSPLAGVLVTAGSPIYVRVRRSSHAAASHIVPVRHSTARRVTASPTDSNESDDTDSNESDDTDGSTSPVDSQPSPDDSGTNGGDPERTDNSAKPTAISSPSPSSSLPPEKQDAGEAKKDAGITPVPAKAPEESNTSDKTVPVARQGSG